MHPVTSSLFSPAHRALAGALVALLAWSSPTAQASGTRVGFKDAFATGRGNAFVATADNPSAIYYNPAGLTQLDGAQFATNIYEVAVSSEYSGAGGTAAMKDDYQTIPAFYATSKLAGSPMAYGFGIYVPFGLSTDWPDSSPLRTFALRNVQKFITYNFSVAWQVNPDLSAGLGLTYNHASTDLRRALGIFGPNDLFRFSGSGHSIGFDLGLLWKPSAEHSFGLSYTHHTSIKFSGVSDTIPLINGEPADATFQFPEVLIVGWSYRPTSQWNIEANLDWTNWNRLNTVTVNKASGNTPLPFNWESGCFYEIGATRYLDGGWHASAGYCYTPNSTPDATYTPAVPDSNRSFYSFGVGYKSDRFSADFAWHYADGGTRHVTGSPPSLIGATADGTYKNSINAFSLSLGLRF
jgi:long-chain fatty acid transport protein